jgi:hypothetical protein
MTPRFVESKRLRAVQGSAIDGSKERDEGIP